MTSKLEPIHLYTGEMPVNADVAELVTKRWLQTTVDEYAQALRLASVPGHLPRAWTGTWSWKGRLEPGDAQITIIEAPSKATPNSADLWARFKDGRRTHPLRFAPYQALEQVVFDPSISFVAERNLFNELVRGLPTSPNPNVQMRYWGEFFFHLCTGGDRLTSIDSWLALLSRHQHKPFVQAYFEQGWWWMCATNGTEAVMLRRPEFKLPTAYWKMGMFNGEWLTPPGKPLPKLTLRPGWWIAPIGLYRGPRTKTMLRIDTDYERVPSTGEDYYAMFGHPNRGSQPSPWPGWQDQVRDNGLVGDQRWTIALVEHFIQKGWL